MRGFLGEVPCRANYVVSTSIPLLVICSGIVTECLRQWPLSSRTVFLTVGEAGSLDPRVADLVSGKGQIFSWGSLWASVTWHRFHLPEVLPQHHLLGIHCWPLWTQTLRPSHHFKCCRWRFRVNGGKETSQEDADHKKAEMTVFLPAKI